MSGAPLTTLTVATTAALDLALAWAVGALVTRQLLRQTLRTFPLAIAAAIAATLALAWCRTATIADLPLDQAAPAIAPVIAQTHVGRATALLLAALIALALAERWRQAGLASIALLIVLAAHAAGGHAGASGAVLPVAIETLHLAAEFVWSGSVLVAAAASFENRLTVGYVGALSRAATWALAVALITGAANAWLRLDGELAAAPTTDYGRILIAKLVLVASAVALGGLNRAVTLPRLRTGDADGHAQRFLRIVLRIEAVVLALAVTAAALLSTIAPGSAGR